MFKMAVYENDLFIYEMEFAPHERSEMLKLQREHIKLGFDVKIYNIK